MKATTLFVISVLFIRLCRSDRILIDFIRDYYEASNIHQIVIFACWDYAADITRNIMGLDTVISYRPTTFDIDLTDILRVNYYHLGVVLDFDCPLSDNVIEKFSNHLPFNESYHWLVLSHLSSIPMKYLEVLPLTIASELTSAIREKDEFQLYDIYNPSYRHGGSVVITDKGRWTPRNGLHDKLIQYKYTRRTDLQQTCLNFSVVLYDPPLPDFMTYLSTYMSIEKDTLTRAHYPVAMYLQDMYNFSMKIHQATSWGYPVNGSFDGIIGDIISGVIDMSLTPFVFHTGRMDFIEYIAETWKFEAKFTFLHPRISTLRNNFLKPFTDDLWWMILLVGAVYWTLLLLSLVLEHHYEGKHEDTEMTAIDTGLTTVAALSQQGLSDSPNFISGRITFLSLFFWALLLYQFYSASIVSSLMTPPPRWIKTIKALTDSHLDVGAQNISYYWNYFETATDPDVVELYNRKMKSRKEHPNAFLPLDRGFKQIQKGGYAFLCGTIATYPIVQAQFLEEQICGLEEIRIAKPLRLSLIVGKGSPFKKMIIYGVRKIIQSGIIYHLDSIWHVPRPECPKTYENKPTPMGIQEFSPALFLLAIGLGMSVMLLMMEYVHSYMENRLDLARINAFISTQQDEPEDVEVST
ncbi:glutamate [NMDA] receptor subunit 1-like [Fopius arisanus]|uniref:Glutamate [NMDA] receptor subunit 1-like n=1 Tax=Fopius arisanus TaxID=64838 RepID=A0A0C9R1Q4_9HYME|nr:PREDICTED: glutamate [NMDA] receptor subunit 1-like [Fopius arisanus]